MKKKIAIIVDDINTVGGTQTFSKNLKQILKKNFEVNIISLLTHEDVKKRYIHLCLKKNILVLLFGFYILYKLRKYDYCIIASGQTINYFLIWGYGRKFIYRESNLPLNRIKDQKPFKQIILNLFYKIFTRINKKSKFIAPSFKVLKQLLKIGIKKERIFLIENPIPPEHKKLKNLNNRALNLIFSGRPTYIKGFDRIIKFSEKGLMINYFGPKLKFLNKNIIHRGLYFNKSKIILDSKIVLIPSRFEGYPNIFLEALNAGCFIILSNELKWLLNDKISNFVYILKQNNVKDLKKKLIIINRKIRDDNKRKLLNRILAARSSLITFEKYYKKVQALFN